MQSAPRSRTSTWLWILTLVVGVALFARPAEASPGDFYIWAKWRLGHAPYTCQAGAPWVRPNVRPRVPAAWWQRLRNYKPTPCPESPEPPVEPVDTPIEQIRLTPREAALRDAVNAARSRHGLAPLPVEASLERTARAHTKDMIRFGYFGHDWHDGTPFGRWIARHTTCLTAGEILAWRSPQQTPGNAVRQWLKSPGHRAALLSSTWSFMGVELTRRHASVEFGGRC